MPLIARLEKGHHMTIVQTSLGLEEMNLLIQDQCSKDQMKAENRSTKS